VPTSPRGCCWAQGLGLGWLHSVFPRLLLWGDGGNRDMAEEVAQGPAVTPSWLRFKSKQVPNEQCSARKVFYFPSGQWDLLFPVQKS